MSLVEDKELIEISETDFVDLQSVIEKWQHSPASELAHHGRLCCHLAREWIFSTDYAQLNGEHMLTGPRWIRQKYTWGPSGWPMSWCEAVERKTLDCGALSAITREVFTARGVTSYTAQFIQLYTEDSTRHWRKKWDEEEVSSHWINEDLIYHEGVAVVVRDNQIRLWDPSAGWWINPSQTGGYGGLLAVRVCAPHLDFPAELEWGAHRIAANQWQKIERVSENFAAAMAS